MEEIISGLITKLEPKDVIYFLIIIGLFSVIWFLEMSARKKDEIFSDIIQDLRKELMSNGKSITKLTGIVSFLAFNSKKENRPKGA